LSRNYLRKGLRDSDAFDAGLRDAQSLVCPDSDFRGGGIRALAQHTVSQLSVLASSAVLAGAPLGATPARAQTRSAPAAGADYQINEIVHPVEDRRAMPKAKRKLLEDNYERLFDKARRDVCAWEQANL
jgi:hypothetical protein